jgi:large subunit ribosomal protein L32e
MAAKTTETKKPATGKTAAKPAAKASRSSGNALSIKRQLRRTRPAFTRHHPHRKASLGDKWKKPRGLHNKLKDRKRGCGPWVSDGYRTPEAVRGMHISGLVIAHVANASQLTGLDPKTTGVVIARTGAKRQIELIAACQKAGLRVLNHKDTRAQELTSRFTTRKEAREEARAAAKAKQAKAGAKTKAAPKADLSEEEKKAEEERLKQEVLTSKDQ